LNGAGSLEEEDTFGRRVEFNVFDLSGSIPADVMTADPSAPSYIYLDDAKLLRNYDTLN
jgi:hypothetical protein